MLLLKSTTLSVFRSKSVDRERRSNSLLDLHMLSTPATFNHPTTTATNRQPHNNNSSNNSYYYLNNPGNPHSINTIHPSHNLANHSSHPSHGSQLPERAVDGGSVSSSSSSPRSSLETPTAMSSSSCEPLMTSTQGARPGFQKSPPDGASLQVLEDTQECFFLNEYT